MGLELKYCIDEVSDASRFDLDELTGIYHPSRNLTGWGSPNESISSVTVASLLVKLPDQYTLLPTGDPVITDLTGVFPTINGIVHQATALAHGYENEKFPDGQYEIIVKYQLGSNPYSPQFRTRPIFFAQVECCITQLIAEVEDQCCDKKSQKYKDMQDGVWKLQGLKAMIECGKMNRAIETLKELQLICQRNPCKSC